VRFHVEHFYIEILTSLFPACKVDREKAVILSENSKYNLTGHKNIDDVIHGLVIDSLSPLKFYNVPRGTSAADMGTGAGIPGIPLAVLYPEIAFTLFDSNNKKIRFIDYVLNELSISNVKCVCCRLEDAAREHGYRETFNIVVSRAMSDVYSAGELCSPFLKTGGYFYLYVSEKQKLLPSPVIEHLKNLSLDIVYSGKTEIPLIIDTTSGLLLHKTSTVADIYPRRKSAIRRGAAEIEKLHK
jgi:16S rRNA (guanine527-N7)-methyltransferase